MSDRISIRQAPSPKHRYSLSLRARMLLLFGGLFALTYIALILVQLYGLPFTGLRGEYAIQQEEVFRDLNLVADLKKDRLLRWIDERKADVDVLSAKEQLSVYVVLLRAAIRERTDSGLTADRLWDEVQQLDSYRNLYRVLTRIRTAFPEYESVSICDWRTLTIIASSNEDELGGTHTSPSHADSLYLVYSQDTYIADVEVDNHSGRPSLHFAGTIREIGADHTLKDEILGLIVIDVNLDNVFKPMLHTGGGLGKTGEVLLVNTNRQILTHLKHPLADGSAASPLEYTINTAATTLAVQGKEGLLTSGDYRGVPVLAAYRYLRVSPEIGWGMVAKIDEAEAYAPLREILEVTLVTSLSALILVLGIAALIARKLSCPIIRLSRVAEEVEAGNLSARVMNTGGDEVGVLGRAFNAMIERIQNWHEDLEQKVVERTEELKSKNVQLSAEIKDRKRAEEQFRFLSQITEQVTDSVITTDLDFKITYVN
ncbi:MAG: HAMP domain-containing protein, partial [candidate division Zixibacteria bacterium]|nr:HAMP domain-containing protein [candidate division Zixibacteria bacterium]